MDMLLGTHMRMHMLSILCHSMHGCWHLVIACFAALCMAASMQLPYTHAVNLNDGPRSAESAVAVQRCASAHLEQVWTLMWENT